ncbi:MAG: DUF6125 family protein [Bacteroidia bacterium]|nr:DUF6125 family protein [Bacteroidia bacterium]
MTVFQEITKEELRELLVSNWMTHDAMWLNYMAKEYGMEATNTINKIAARMMARVEAKRVKKLLKMENPKNLEEFKVFIINIFELTQAHFINFNFSFQEPDTIFWHIPQCFAFEGMTKTGNIAQYDCGIKYRLMGWLDELNVSFEIQPEFTGCLMYQNGNCGMTIKLNFG